MTVPNLTRSLFADNLNHVDFYSDNNYYRVKIYNANYSQQHGERSSISDLNGIDGGTVKLVFDIISQTPDITIDKLILETGKSRCTISRALKHLKDNGYIARVGSDKSGVWKILK